MKVKCINIYNEFTKEYQSQSNKLTIGKEYIILESIICDRKGLSYRLVGDNKDKMPAIYKASQFEISSEFIPSNWGITINKRGLIVLGPKAWREKGFWEGCYEADPKPLEIYKRETRIIYEEEEVEL